jgi:hypothetical protein
MAKRTTPRTPANLELLSAEQRAALTTQAHASVLEEMSQAARDKFFQDEIERIRREQVPEDQIVSITIDVAPFVPFIMLDGTQYFHGYTYQVPHKVRLVILEQCQRSWLHQDEIDGRSRTDAYRRPRDLKIGPSNAGTPTRGFATGAVVNAEV